MGSPGIKLDVVSLVVQLGGFFHHKRTTPDGQVFYGKFIYHQIETPNKLAFTNAFAAEEGNTIRAPFSDSWPLEILNTLTFSEQNGQTVITMEGLPFNATEAETETFQSAHENIKQGFAGTFAQLEEYIGKVK